MIPFARALAGRYGQEKISSKAAALSYFTIFSLGPLLFVVLGVLGLVLNSPGYKERLIDQMQSLVGPQAGELLAGVANSPGLGSKTGLAFALGGIGLLLGAIGIFGQLQSSLNSIFHVSTGQGIKDTLKRKLWSLALVGLICFLLVVSLLASTLIALIAAKFTDNSFSGLLFSSADFVISTLVLCGLLAIIYRTLPDIKIAWRLLFKASLVVAVLFTLGKIALGYIIGNNSSVTAFGAAGSLVTLLLWIFYSGQLVFLGAAGISLSLNHNPQLAKPRFPGITMKREEIKRPMGPRLVETTWQKFLNGLRAGWSDGQSKKK